jgi:hypothetical protein
VALWTWLNPVTTALDATVGATATAMIAAMIASLRNLSRLDKISII